MEFRVIHTDLGFYAEGRFTDNLLEAVRFPVQSDIKTCMLQCIEMQVNKMTVIMFDIENLASRGTITLERAFAIQNYQEKQRAYHEAESQMSKLWEDYKVHLEDGDIKGAKESMRGMPECTDKILAFREILIVEDSLSNE